MWQYLARPSLTQSLHRLPFCRIISHRFSLHLPRSFRDVFGRADDRGVRDSLSPFANIGGSSTAFTLWLRTPARAFLTDRFGVARLDLGLRDGTLLRRATRERRFVDCLLLDCLVLDCLLFDRPLLEKSSVLRTGSMSCSRCFRFKYALSTLRFELPDALADDLPDLAGVRISPSHEGCEADLTDLTAERFDASSIHCGTTTRGVPYGPTERREEPPRREEAPRRDFSKMPSCGSKSSVPYGP